MKIGNKTGLFGRSEERSVNSARNIFFALLFFILSLVASFINRTVFTRCLETEYLGLRGLMTSLLTFLSLAELGIGSAVSYALYRPLMERDTPKIRALMGAFRKWYRIVGAVILALGAALTPFLAFFMKEIPEGIPMGSVRIYFMLYAANTAASFFLAYKRILIVSDQRGYISEITGGISKLALTALQVAVLLITHSFLWYLVVMILCTAGECLVISRIADRLYPFLGEGKEQLGDGEKKDLRKNISAILMHNIGSVVVFSTDNMIISKFVGLVSVGLYSNYTLIITSVNAVISRIFSAATASLGNLMAEDPGEKGKKVFGHVLFLNAWLEGWAAICLMCLMQPFVRIWLGAEYVMEPAVLAAAVVSFYLTGARSTVLTFKNASGVFRQDRYKPLVESAVNIAASIPLAIQYGIAGVLAGTVISTLTVAFWYEAKVFFRDRFHEGYGKYLLTQAKYFALNAALFGVCWGLARLVPVSEEAHPAAVFLIRLGICLVVPNGAYFLCFRKSEDMAYFREMVRRLAARFRAGKKTETDGEEAR